MGTKLDSPLPHYAGLEFPTFIHRKNGSTKVSVEIPIGEVARVSFLTDVKNNYFSRKKQRGQCDLKGAIKPSVHLFNGRLTFTCSMGKTVPLGSELSTLVTITDAKGSGPFELEINAKAIESKTDEIDDTTKQKHPPKDPKGDAGPSRPDIKELDKGPEEPPLTIEKIPNTDRLQLVLNTTSKLLENAKHQRPKEEESAVEFVFKYGLALTAIGLLDAVKKTEAWKTDEAGCRERIQASARGIARVIVPLCLSLPKKLPKAK